MPSAAIVAATKIKSQAEVGAEFGITQGRVSQIISGTKNKGSVTTFVSRGADYQLARLRRDRPDLAERVERRELTANAAAIEAGFRAKQVQLAKDPHRAAQAIIAARGLTYAKDHHRRAPSCVV